MGVTARRARVAARARRRTRVRARFAEPGARLEAGTRTETLRLNALGSGLYFARLEWEGRIAVRRFAVVC